MTFREATDHLFARIDHEDLARSLGVSVATIRQARLKDSARAQRSPPSGWETVVLELAQQRKKHYEKLTERLQAENLTQAAE